MTLNNFVYLILLLLSCYYLALPIDSIVQVLSEVKQHYLCCSVILLYSEEQLRADRGIITNGDDATSMDAASLVRVSHLLATRGVASTSLDLRVLSSVLQDTSCCPLFVLLVPDESSRIIISQVSRTMSLSSGHWLLFLGRRSARSYFSDANVPFDCELLVARESAGRMFFSEAYHIARGGPLVVLAWGDWSTTQGLLAPRDGLLQRRRDLQGLVIEAAAREMPSMLEGLSVNGEATVITGFDSQLWDVLQRTLNFTVKYVNIPGCGFGSLKNGSWSGFIRKIWQGKYLMSANNLGMNVDRPFAGHFAQPMHEDKNLVFIRRPEAEHNGWQGVVAPFHWSLWMALFTTVVAVALVLAALQCLGRLSSGVQLAMDRQPFYIFLSDVIAMFCQQGVDVPRATPRSRLVLFLTYLTAVVVSTAFSCNIIAFLSVQRVEAPFSTYDSLLSDSTYELHVTRNASGYNILLNATVGTVLAEVYARFIRGKEDAQMGSHEEGLMRMCSQKRFAFFTRLDMTLHFAEKLNCTPFPLDATANIKNYAFLFHKRNPYRRLFITSLERLRRSGVLQLLQNHQWPSLPSPEADTTVSTVALDIVRPFFLLLTLGGGAALLVLAMEYGIWCYSQ